MRKSKSFLTFICLIAFAVCAKANPVANAILPFVEGGEVAGVVTLIVGKDKILDFQTFGYADFEKKTPMQKDTMFWIASQTKTFTAVLFMMLVEEGKVSLDDPVSKYIPEFKNAIVENEDGSKVPAKSQITMRQLLAHSAGMLRKCPSIKLEDTFTLEEKVKEYAKMTLKYQPGEDYRYSNIDTNTVGRVIEIVSGKSYESFLEERITRPLGMKNTTFVPSAKQLERLATGYVKPKEKGKFKAKQCVLFSYPLDNPKRQPMPGGGLFSCAEDVAKFCQMLLNGGTFEGRRYLSENSIAEMRRKQAAGDSSYGLCVYPDEYGFGHSGAWGTKMWIMPSYEIATVIMVQLHDGGVKEMKNAFNEAARELVSSKKQ